MSTTKAKVTAEPAAAAEKAIHTATDFSAKGFDKTLLAMKDGMEKASKSMEASQHKIKEGVEKAMKTAEEVIAFSQGNVEAMVKSSQIYASGFQEISKKLAAHNKAALEESVAFTKSLMGVKSVKEAMDLQSGFTRTTIEKLVAETSKVTDASVKLAEEALAPLTARVSVAVSSFGKTH
jgi:phasin family protein